VASATITSQVPCGAADQGHAIAQLFLGWAYEDGAGVPEDDERVAFWFRKSANHGDATGQYMLAEMFLEGRGVPQDPEQAVSWYSKAADQGDSNAKIELGKIYDAGIVQDPQQAARWYREAEAAETADRIPPSHLWQGRESRVLTLKTPRGIEEWRLVDGRPRFLVSVREKGSTV
jgi:TPR repeat protein